MKAPLTLALIAAAMLSAITPVPALAAPVVTYGYTGVVDSDDALRGLSAFTGKFSFDTTAVDQIADPQTGDYKMAFWPLGMNATFDGGAASISIGDMMDVLVTNDLGGQDTLGALARTSDLLTSLSLTLFDFNALVFNSDARPGGNLKFSDFGWGSFVWEGVDGVLQGHLTGLTCLDGCDTLPGGGGGGGGGCQPGAAPCPVNNLPEPTAPALSLAGLLAVLISRRTRQPRKSAPLIQPPTLPDRRRNWSHAGFLFGALTVLPVASVQAQTVIDQSRALAGNISPGDGAGFPVTLSQPGSYKLTSNLTVPAGVPAIVISVPGVTLDLNGFSVTGPYVCPNVGFCAPAGASNGIEATVANVSIRNGTIKQFAGHGIVIAGSGLLQDLVVRDNGGIGVNRASASAPDDARIVMRGVQALVNGSHGIATQDTELVDCQASKNGGHGFLLSDSTLLDSSAAKNRNHGVWAAGNTLLRGNQLYQNGTKNYGNWIFSAGGNLSDTQLF